MPATRDEIIDLLDEVKDPEVPALSVVELGVVRDAIIADDGAVEVVITPTYSGCPAMKMIEDGIRDCLVRHGHEKTSVRTTFSPAWTTDWMTDEAKEKLRAYGIAPPGRTETSPCGLPPKDIACPYCGSANTELRAEFGATACKSFHYCNDCTQPFEHFKCI